MFKVNIYTPTYHRLEMTKRCLESIIPFVESSVYDTTLYICDNNSNKEMVSWLETLVKGRVKLFKSDKNVGKAAIINSVYDVSSNCTHFISIDSDMIADETQNFVDQMVWCIEHFPHFGLLSTFQKQNNQQLWDGLTTKQTIEQHTVSFGRYNSVAGGCIILKKEMWDAIGGYSTFGGVYGFDDGLMMQSVHNKQKLVGVIDTVRLTHPFDDNEKYKEWKSKNIAKRRQTGFYEE
jgi:GT2 family glycosyltransferase